MVTGYLVRQGPAARPRPAETATRNGGPGPMRHPARYCVDGNSNAGIFLPCGMRGMHRVRAMPLKCLLFFHCKVFPAPFSSAKANHWWMFLLMSPVKVSAHLRLGSSLSSSTAPFCLPCSFRQPFMAHSLYMQRWNHCTQKAKLHQTSTLHNYNDYSILVLN